MKIKSVTADWLHVPIPEEKQHVTDFGRISSFDSILARIETECGIVGYGEARPAAGSAGAGIALKVLIERELGPLIIGKDPRQISLLWDILYNGSRAHFAVDRGHVFPILGRRGITICGISGIDIALWDILGKSLGVPVHQLLGGKRRDRMPAYASGGWAPADRITDELQRFLDIGGFKAVKMRVGSADGDLATSVARVRAARKGLGEKIDIMCDAHGTYGVTEAKRFCEQLRDCRIAWFEEPVTADDKRGLAEIRAATDIPISTGESEFTRFDFRDLIEHRAADILQPDISIAGGITEFDAHRSAVRRLAASFRRPYLGRRHDLRRRAACLGRRVHGVHPGIFLRRQPAAARTGRGEIQGGRRHDRDPRPTRPRRHHRRGLRPQIQRRGLRRAGAVNSLRGIDDMAQRLARPHPPDRVDDVAHRRRRVGDAGVVRRHRDLGMRPERAVGGQRLGLEDVERGAAELPRVERRQDVRFHLMPAAPRVDQAGAARQAGEQVAVQDALRLGRQRQQADEDFRPREKGPEPVRAVEAL